ncbi:transporter [Pseudolabrys sp. Root1462]|jgi:membrane fusion protein (multidrug efflux system)|uniref:HlyD family secretion protein n=1 Tax=Pseudolabrys sp. Root1462 TaxID=1736466 RepID=UPI000702FEB4|nr:HlyD family secretion protein [Pseudolabrys sp. Root1462]KQY97439.1 transporter [Pseudolabrys sp. Root1462]
MSEKVLKVVPAPEAKSKADQASTPDAAAETPAKAPSKRRNLRRVLLIVLPLAVALIGGTIYLLGGRYVSTDNAYIGAQKVLITPDVSGKVVRVMVKEGQHVKAGDELMSLDSAPYQLVLDQAAAKLSAAKIDYEKAKTNLAALNKMLDLGDKAVELKQRDFDRKQKLVASQAGSAADLDTSGAALVTAQQLAAFTKQQRDTTLGSLLNDENLPLEKFPEYAQAKAAFDNAQRDLSHTVLRAPINGTATQVDNIQLGRFVAAGAPILTVIDDSNPWIDANPKETDMTYLRVGQKATIDVDAFPDRTFTGTVIAVSPGTGSQFSLLPAQNATGNWVKVVQRVPIRIAFDKSQDLALLRTGMSVNIEVDTHHSRIPFMSKDPDAK